MHLLLAEEKPVFFGGADSPSSAAGRNVSWGGDLLKRCERGPLAVRGKGVARAAVFLAAGLVLGSVQVTSAAGGSPQVAVGRTLDQANPSTNDLALPAPVPAKREELPAGFLKSVPGSIAELRAIEDHVKALVAKVSPAVVAVEVGNATGTGVIVSSDGLVLSAAHVVGGPGRRVLFRFADGKTARGRTIGFNEDVDAGLMRISDRTSLPHVPLGELQTIKPGDWVLALGHPGGFDTARSLVARLGRLIRLGSNTLQSDCTIAPGDSGGPLIDMHGRLIGIHTTISGSMAENYHVPITKFYSRWEDLVQNAAGVAGRTSAQADEESH